MPKIFSGKSIRPTGDHLWSFYLPTFETTCMLPLHHWQTNCISLNKLHTLKHGNCEKPGFQWNAILENTFFSCWNIFLASEFCIQQCHVCHSWSPKNISQTKERTLANPVLMLPLGLILFVLLEQVLLDTEKSWNQPEHWYKMS